MPPGCQMRITKKIASLSVKKILSGNPNAYGTITFGAKGHLRYRDLILQQEADRQAQAAAIEEQSRLQRELTCKQAKEDAEKKRKENTYLRYFLLFFLRCFLTSTGLFPGSSRFSEPHILSSPPFYFIPRFRPGIKVP